MSEGLTTFNTISNILRLGGAIVWSWGTNGLKSTYFKNMYGASFKVNGKKFKGVVTICYNIGNDLFEIYYTDKFYTEKLDSDLNVYVSDLIRTIDLKIES